MSTNQDSRLDTAKSLLHREAEALLRIERQHPGTYPNNMIKLFDDIVIYSTNKSGQAKTTLDNINIAFISAVQALKKSHSVEKKAPISDDMFISLHSMQFYMYEIRYIQEIVYREKQITALTENAETIKQTVTANKELNDDLHQKIPSLDTIINDKISKIENEYEQFSTLIKNNTKNAITLFDLSSIESTEKIFGLRSSEESRIANQFRNYSLGIMGLIALIDILFLWKGLLSGFESLDAFSAVTLSLLLLTPSIYLSKESNKHRKFEQQNLKIQQNIAAVMSVTSTMNEDDKKQIKQAITTALLENMQPSETDDSSPSIHFNVSEKLLNMIKST